jgi:hypothetical protein
MTVNYRGHPFMLSLRDNKSLSRSLIAGEVFVMLLIGGVRMRQETCCLI